MNTTDQNSLEEPARDEAPAGPEDNNPTTDDQTAQEECSARAEGGTESPAAIDGTQEDPSAGDDEQGVPLNGVPEENVGAEEGNPSATQSQSEVTDASHSKEEGRMKKRSPEESPGHDGGEAGEPDTQTIPRGPFLEAEALLSVVDGPRALLDKGDTARETIQCDDPRRLATVERLVVSWESLPAPDQVPTAVEEEDVDETMVQIPSEDIPRFLGKGCNTQKKIVRASGVESATVKENLEKDGDKEQKAAVVFRGTKVARERAAKYMRIVLSRRGAEVEVDLSKDDDGDLTVMRDVPRSAVALILGSKGAKLRGLEDKWGTMAFLLGNLEPLPGESQVSSDKVVVAIFGESHARKHCEMEVRNLVDAKVHGFYTGRMKESLSGEEGEASDIIEMDKSDAILLFEDHVSVKRKLEELSGATICRLSNFVDVFGTNAQREKAREYIQWTVAGLLGEAVVIEDAAERDDCTEVEIPTEMIDVLFGKGRRRQQEVRQLQDKFECLLLLGKESSEDTLVADAESGDDSDPSADTPAIPPTTTTPLFVVGPWARRRQCMYMILAKIEASIPGWITSSIEARLADDDEVEGGYACDRLWLPELGGEEGKDRFNEALTDVPLYTASGAIAAVIGPMVFVEGGREQRLRCEQYIKWLLVAERRLSRYQQEQEKEDEKERRDRHGARRVKSLEPWQEEDLRVERVKEALGACLVLSCATLQERGDITEVGILEDNSAEEKKRLLEMTIPKTGSGKGQKQLKMISSQTGTLCLLAADRPVDEQIEELPRIRVMVLGEDERRRDAAAVALKGAFRNLLWEKEDGGHGSEQAEEWRESPRGQKWKDRCDRWRDGDKWGNNEGGGRWHGKHDANRWQQNGSKGDQKGSSSSSWSDWKEWKDARWEHKEESWGSKKDDWGWKGDGGRGGSWKKDQRAGGDDGGSSSWDGWEKDRWGNWRKKDEVEGYSGGRRREEPMRRSWAAVSSPARVEPPRDTWFKRETPRIERASSSRGGAPSSLPYGDDYRYSTFRDQASPRQTVPPSTSRYAYRGERVSNSSIGDRGRPAWQEKRRREPSPYGVVTKGYRDSSSPPPRRGVPTERFYQEENSYYYRPQTGANSMPVEKAYYQRPESSPKRRRVEAPAQSTWEARGGYSDPAPPPWQRSYQDVPSTNRGSGGSGPGQSYGQRRSGGAVLSQAPSAASSSAAAAAGGSRGRYLMKDVKGGGSGEYPSLGRR